MRLMITDMKNVDQTILLEKIATHERKIVDLESVEQKSDGGNKKRSAVNALLGIEENSKKKVKTQHATQPNSASFFGSLSNASSEQNIKESSELELDGQKTNAANP